MVAPTSAVSLKVEPASLNRSRLGTISGRIYLQTGTGGFPSAGWSDIVLPMLCAWFNALKSLAASVGGRRGYLQRECLGLAAGSRSMR
jgi:hypothetical protein